MKTSKSVLLIAAACIAMAGCAKKNVREVTPGTAMEGPTTSTSSVASSESGHFTPADLDTDSCLRQRSIYFDLDKDTIKPEFQAIIACHAKYLTDRPMAKMTLEGNTDERGTREYNRGLGERRGNAVEAALQGGGASASQMDVVSYGEERPVCTESNEDCWSKNRRVDIVYSVK